MKRLADARTFGRKRETERYTGVNTMQLCKHSKSVNFRSTILTGCPLGLTTTEAKKCPCRNRLYHQGPQDLRVLSCCFPKTWRGDEIRDAEAFAGSLKTSPKERNVEVTEETQTPKPTETVEKKTALTVQPKPAGSTFMSRVADPMKAAMGLGKAFWDSKMFGCKNLAQGQAMALTCIMTGIPPAILMQTYHIIGGKLSMKSDVMLAEFRKAGGDHTIVTRTPDVAEVEFKFKRKSQKFKFTWEEAKEADFIYTKAVAEFPSPKRLKLAELAEKGERHDVFKDNWGTRRGRMQMLWHRVVSDGLRTFHPESMAGFYTPEDLGVTSDPGQVDDDVVEAEFEVTQPAEAACDELSGPPFVEEAEVEPPTVPADPIVAEVTTKVTREQLQEMVAMKKKLEYDRDTWKRVLGQFGVTTAHDLGSTQADELIDWLGERQKSVAAKNELDEYANRIMGIGQPTE